MCITAEDKNTVIVRKMDYYLSLYAFDGIFLT